MLSLQEWNSCLVSDEVMAQSYQDTGDLQRSWMKKFIAYLLSFYGHETRSEYIETARRKTGFSQTRTSFPVPKTVILTDTRLKSWNRLLAAAIPAIAAGTDEILVFLNKEDKDEPCPEILTSLELAGIENIFVIPSENVRLLFQGITEDGPLAIMDLCTQSPVEKYFYNHPRYAQKYIRLILRNKPEILIWAEHKNSWDYEAIQRAHPDAGFTLAGPVPGDAPQNFIRTDADIHELFKKSFDLFLGPEKMFTSCAIPRGFSRGMEPFWLWPEIDNSFFTINRIHLQEIV
ncbi:MAG: hypothetical protein ACLFP9_03455 [Desulfonatronovibrio sp.]